MSERETIQVWSTGVDASNVGCRQARDSGLKGLPLADYFTGSSPS